MPGRWGSARKSYLPRALREHVPSNEWRPSRPDFKGRPPIHPAIHPDDKPIRFKGEEYDVMGFAGKCCVCTVSMRRMLQAADWDVWELPKSILRNAKGE